MAKYTDKQVIALDAQARTIKASEIPNIGGIIAAGWLKANPQADAYRIMMSGKPVKVVRG